MHGPLNSKYNKSATLSDTSHNDSVPLN